jgi:hypothetical protein
MRDATLHKDMGEVNKSSKSGFFLGCEPLPELLPLFFFFPFSDQDAAGERSVIAGVQMYGVILANELPPFAAADQSPGAGRVTESGLFESLVKAMECKHKDVCSLLSVRRDCKEYRTRQMTSSALQGPALELQRVPHALIDISIFFRPTRWRRR